jgi:hypothetical protein
LGFPEGEETMSGKRKALKKAVSPCLGVAGPLSGTKERKRFIQFRLLVCLVKWPAQPRKAAH